ncbi:UbiX family flavin prenyltransferase [Deinococcus metallilatus]|uniref:Flavin prenyltransferase UbiX n=1 Tax=Deinococcus metallilatus TaxID=1211322 RepID=A0AAJ5F372_9DEIO|nr:UbiX family flavin prenyltransferase [Deinococcus metallilatus]MBB5296288.1 4-hydroxy-3-polyprenylbenzoate decarboxylase [Deinococcus metallilatus]QBY10027.1 UbiX family flavin prenyltransferase [Deinococcus metallilatus]RXJ08751.1 UbiX family flavin prenyltransferase [Deinococcus metallilatus]TLK25225.1 UbiX family flavin prenyltransferase [Deinococcus metallilatus]GMA14800.1 flavin prenyltransferase UbiX [Deinococcus metallilatus]
MRLVVGVSGGSGIPYALSVLRALRELEVETHLIVTSGAKRVMTAEGGPQLADLTALARVTHDDRDLAASIASGSLRTDGMLIVPCSAGTLAKVAGGFADNLLARAAHVTLKERRRLVLVLREDPLSRPMLQNMLSAFDAGATVMTASPGFYHAPDTVEKLLHFVTARVLDQFGLDVPGFRRWKEAEA